MLHTDSNDNCSFALLPEAGLKGRLSLQVVCTVQVSWRISRIQQHLIMYKTNDSSSLQRCSMLQAGFSLADALKERESNRCKPKTKQKAAAGSLQPKNRAAISRVLLIGGATRMPSFQKFAENMTGMKPDLLLADPDLVGVLEIQLHCIQSSTLPC